MVLGSKIESFEANLTFCLEIKLLQQLLKVNDQHFPAKPRRQDIRDCEDPARARTIIYLLPNSVEIK